MARKVVLPKTLGLVKILMALRRIGDKAVAGPRWPISCWALLSCRGLWPPPRLVWRAGACPEAPGERPGCPLPSRAGMDTATNMAREAFGDLLDLR